MMNDLVFLRTISILDKGVQRYNTTETHHNVCRVNKAYNRREVLG